MSDYPTDSPSPAVSDAPWGSPSPTPSWADTQAEADQRNEDELRLGWGEQDPGFGPFGEEPDL